MYLAKSENFKRNSVTTQTNLQGAIHSIGGNQETRKPEMGVSRLFYFLAIFSSLPYHAVSDDPSLPALGRTAGLGEFYDARNQSFLGVKIFKDDIGGRFDSVDNFSRLIETTDTAHTDIRYGIVKGDHSKLNHLDVNAKIKVEVMSGQVVVVGSASYFNEPKKSSFDVEGFLYYKTRTKRQILNLLYKDMEDHLHLDLMKQVEATHIVIGIEYGCDVVVKFLERNENAEEKSKIQGSLELAFKNPKVSISAAADATIKDETKDVLSNFSMSVYGDINVPSGPLRNSKDVLDLIADIPKELKKVNSGFGVPMRYTLFPLSTLAQLLRPAALRQKIVNELDEAILNDFVKMFEKIERVQRDLNDLQWTLDYYKNCTGREDLARMEDLNNKFSEAALQFKIDVKNAMNAVRVLPPIAHKDPEKPDDNSEDKDENSGDSNDSEQTDGNSGDSENSEQTDENSGDSSDSEQTGENSGDSENSEQTDENSGDAENSDQTDENSDNSEQTDENSDNSGNSEQTGQNSENVPEPDKDSENSEKPDEDSENSEKPDKDAHNVQELDKDAHNVQELDKVSENIDHPDKPKNPEESKTEEVVENSGPTTENPEKQKNSQNSTMIQSSTPAVSPKVNQKTPAINKKSPENSKLLPEKLSRSTHTKRRSISKSESEKQRDEILKKVLNDYNSNSHSANEVAKRLETEFEGALNKIELYKVFQSAGVQYFGRFGSFNNLRLRENSKIVYAIIMHNSEDQNWNDNWELFLNQLNRPFSTLAIVDCAFKDPICESTDHKTVTRQYFRSKLISDDVFAHLNKMREEDPLILTALGVDQEIGDLYDARTQQFTGKTIVTPGVKLNLTSQIYGNETIDYLTGWRDEKIRSINVQPPALIYNLLLSPKGFPRSGRFFQEGQFYDPGFLSRSLLHIFNTLEESVLDADEDSFDFIQISRLLRGGATHFVHKVLYGGQTSISLVAKISVDLSSPEVTEKTLVLKQHLREIGELLTEKSRLAPEPEIVVQQSEIKCGAAAKSPEYNSSAASNPSRNGAAAPQFFSSFSSDAERSLETSLKNQGYIIKFASDVFENSRGEFRTSRDLLNFLDDFPNLKNKGCQGRGRPVLFVLYPLVNLQKYFGVIPSAESPAVFSGPEDNLRNTTLALEFSRVFDSLRQADGLLSQLKERFKDNRTFVTDETLDGFRTIEKDFERLQRDFKNNVRHLTTKYPVTPIETERESPNRDDQLRKFLQDFEASPETQKFFDVTKPYPEFIANNKFSGSVKKIQQFRKILQHYPEIKYKGRDLFSLSEELTNYQTTTFIYILFYKSEFDLDETARSSWLDNLNLFTGFLYGKPYNRLIILDCDFKDVYCQNKSDPAIHLYANLAWRSKNVLKEWNAALLKLQNGETVTLERRALGHRVKLGQFYDARREKFVDISGAGESKLSNEAIKSLIFWRDKGEMTSPVTLTATLESEESFTPIVKVKSQVIPFPALDERFAALDIEPELQLAFLFDDLLSDQKLVGSAEFLEEKLKFSSAVLLTSTGASAALNLNSSFLSDFFRAPIGQIYNNPQNSRNEWPTHFVKEIRFGVNSIVTLGQSVLDQDVEFVQRVFGGQLEKVEFDQSELRSQFSSNFSRGQVTPLEFSEDFTIFSDLPLLPNKMQAIRGGNFKAAVTNLYETATTPELFIPTNFQELQNSDFKFPTVSFVLEPIETLQQSLGILAPSLLYKHFEFSPDFLANNTIPRIIQFYQKFSKAVDHAQNLNRKISTSFNFAMTDEFLEKSQKMKETLKTSFLNFKMEFRKTLEMVKNGGHVENELTTVLEKFDPYISVDGFPAILHDKMSGWSAILSKLKFVEQVKDRLSQSPNLKYLGQNSNFNDVVFRSQRVAPKYLLYLPQNLEAEQGENSNPFQPWIKTLQDFFQFLVIPENDGFIVDCSFPDFPGCKDPTLSGDRRRPVIHQYLDGQLTSRDFITSQKNQTEKETSARDALVASLKEQVTTLNRSCSEDHVTINEMMSKLNNNSNLLRGHDQSLGYILEQNVTRREIVRIVGRTDELDGNVVVLKKKQQGVERDLSSTMETLRKLQGKVNILDSRVSVVNNTLEEFLFPRSCSLSHDPKRKQKIYPGGLEKPGVVALCDFETDGGGWTIIQKRSSGPREEFYRGWTEYEDGFGSVDKNYWIGLRNIYALTKGNDQELRIELKDWDGNVGYAKYSTFTVSDASDYYRLSIDGFSGNVGDSIMSSRPNRNLNGMRFSTRDKDNDNWTGGNCAERYKTAWWYNNCADSELNGLYFEKGETADPEFSGILWYSWKNNLQSLQAVEMKIRRKF